MILMTPERFKQALSALANQHRALPPDPADRRRKANRLRAMRDYRWFAQRYFAHYLTHGESLLHAWLFERLGRLGNEKGVKLAVAAPRGEAKSTLVTLIYVLWCAASRRKRYIPILMDAHQQAVSMLAAIKGELTDNDLLKEEFPELTGVGPVWREEVIVTNNDVKLQAFGSTQRMRGLRHRQYRPDLVIGDDLENDRNAASREQRDALERWLHQAVLKLGPPDDSLTVICIGTLLHHDALIARLLNNPLWESRRFQAMVRWPDDAAAWDRWEEILRREGEPAADAFFQQHREAMLAGAVVSWPQVRSVEVLMKIRARDGRKAFDAELQNQPSSDHNLFGTPHFWQRENRDWLFFGAVDPSLGKSGGRGDPSAILVGGYDRLTGILDVVEADLSRRHPDRIIEDVIACQLRYPCRLWVVEAVQFQEFFKDELIRRSAIRGVPVPAKGIRPGTDKGLRISSLQPHIQNGLIRFHPAQRELLDQVRHWGDGPIAHDDGLDALHMLWQAAVAEGRGLAEGHRSAGARLTTTALEGGSGVCTDQGFGTVRRHWSDQGY